MSQKNSPVSPLVIKDDLELALHTLKTDEDLVAELVPIQWRYKAGYAVTAGWVILMSICFFGAWLSGINPELPFSAGLLGGILGVVIFTNVRNANREKTISPPQHDSYERTLSEAQTALRDYRCKMLRMVRAMIADYDAGGFAAIDRSAILDPTTWLGERRRYRDQVQMVLDNMNMVMERGELGTVGPEEIGDNLLNEIVETYTRRIEERQTQARLTIAARSEVDRT